MHDFVTLRHLIIIVHVHFRNFEFSAVFLAQRFKSRRKLLARPAPHGAEIHQNGQFGIHNLAVERIVVHLYQFVHKVTPYPGK